MIYIQIKILKFYIFNIKIRTKTDCAAMRYFLMAFWFVYVTGDTKKISFLLSECPLCQCVQWVCFQTLHLPRTFIPLLN